MYRAWTKRLHQLNWNFLQRLKILLPNLVSAPTPLAGQQEGHLACKQLGVGMLVMI